MELPEMGDYTTNVINYDYDTVKSNVYNYKYNYLEYE